MPLTYFYCPNGEQREIKECLKDCPRKEGRCLSGTTLIHASIDNPLVYGNQQLINPTRMEFLKATKPYGIKPDEAEFYKPDIYPLHKIEQNGTTGYRLIEHRDWTSRAVVKFLDNPHDRQRKELAASLNLDRIAVENRAMKVIGLFVEITVRDCHTSSAIRNGIQFRTKLYPVDFIDDDTIMCYFANKYALLKTALDTKTLPPVCSESERWNNRRCAIACPVVNFCPEGAEAAHINLEG